MLILYFSSLLLVAGISPWVPEKGTVGASGDLAPLAHVALGMLGEGKLWGPKTGWADASVVSHFKTFVRISIICMKQIKFNV